ncbi:Major facilitator superfamily domain containing protein [Amanita muscaria]
MKSLKNLSVKSIQVVGPETKKARFGGFFRSSSLSSWWSRLTTRREQETQGQHGEEAKRPTTTTDDLGAVESQEQGQEQDPYPDGGLKAWLMVFGAMCNTFSTFGYVNSWGIFQAYYQTTVLSDSTPSNIAWIGSIQYSLVFLPGLITGRLFDLGYFHSVFLPCSLLLVLATFLVAECHVYWQFLLCQGFAVGLACGGIFGPTTAVIAHWFKKRRGVAMGLVAVGSSIGGSVLPITAQALISRVGFKWTMRILGLIMMLTLGIANLVLKRRLPVRKDVPGGLFNLAEFKKSAAYSVYCASAFTTFLGIYTVLTYIDISAERTPGVSGTTLAFYLVAIANASSMVGRYVAGVACDKVGAINVMAPFTAMAGLVTFVWPFAKSRGGLVAVAVVYGFCSGSYVSLLANPIMDLGDAGDIGRRVGMFMSILALGALAGPPISGAINRATGGFEAVGFYAGSMVLLGVAMMVLVRWLVLRRWRGRI